MIKKILSIIASMILFTGIAYAINVSVPLAPGSNYVLLSNANGQYNYVATSSLGISANPAGSNSDIQFNNSGVFGGTDNAKLDSSGNFTLSGTSQINFDGGAGGIGTLSGDGGGGFGFSSNDGGNVNFMGVGNFMLTDIGSFSLVTGGVPVASIDGSGDATFKGYFSTDNGSIYTNGAGNMTFANEPYVQFWNGGTLEGFSDSGSSETWEIDGSGAATFNQLNYSGGNPLFGGSSLYYGNGNLLSLYGGELDYPGAGTVALADSSNNLYYGNGARLADNNGNLYYPNGNNLANGSGNLFYGSGFLLADINNQIYYPSGSLLSDSQNLYAMKFITTGGSASQVVLGNGTLGTYSTGGSNYWKFLGSNLFPATTTSFVTADHFVASSTTATSTFTNAYFSRNVGIGSSTPSSALAVVGTTTSGGYVSSNLKNTILAVDNSGNFIATTTSGGGSGTVTSVSATTPTGLTVSGSPITTSGTLAFSLTSGYTIPLIASTTQWASAYASTTALNATAPITYNGTTGSIGCNVASGSQAGCLSSADWTTFNGKQPAGSYPTISSGVIGKVARWISSTALGIGKIFDDGTEVGINATSSSYTFNDQANAAQNPFNVASSSGSSLFNVDGSGNVTMTGNITLPSQINFNSTVYTQFQGLYSNLDFQVLDLNSVGQNHIVFTTGGKDILTVAPEGLKLQGGSPSMGTCGTSPSISGNDNVGKVTVGSGVVTSCTVNFGTTKTGTPHVFITVDGVTAIANSVSSVTTGGFTANFAATLGGGTFDYFVVSN